MINKITEKKSKTIAVEGNISAGKTTFLEYVKLKKKEIKVFHFILILIIPEPIEHWSNVGGYNLFVFNMYLEDPMKWSLTFQIHLVTKMIEDLKKDDSQIRLIERTLYTSTEIVGQLLLNEGHIHPIELEILKNLISALELTNCYNLNTIIYLRSSPESCFDRMKDKGIVITRYPIEKMKLLHHFLEKTFVENAGNFSIPIIVVDVIDDLDAMKRVLDQLIESLFNET
ncbi:hypothetical protein HZS_7404 [Henneguya salminicola]|nr:hypothetical protein HZS_7404 [Henneguya salminicola]